MFLLARSARAIDVGGHRLRRRRPDSSESRAARTSFRSSLRTQGCRLRSPVAIAGAFLAVHAEPVVRIATAIRLRIRGRVVSLANIGPNAVRYLNWLIATAPVLLLAPFGFVRVRAERAFAGPRGIRRAGVRRVSRLRRLRSVVVPRFLLPALAVFAIFAAIELTAWIERLAGRRGARRCSLALVLGVMAHGLFVARSLETFKLADQLRRVEQVADFVSRSTPPRRGDPVGRTKRLDALLHRAGDPSMGSGHAGDTARRPSRRSRTPAARSTSSLDAWENEPFLKKFAAVADSRAGLAGHARGGYLASHPPVAHW